jgi:hypothetical protein
LKNDFNLFRGLVVGYGLDGSMKTVMAVSNCQTAHNGLERTDGLMNYTKEKFLTVCLFAIPVM